MLKSRGPSIEPCGTLDVIALLVLKQCPTLRLCLLFVKKFFIKIKDRPSKPYASI